MVFCKNCGTELRNGAKFCHKCGTKVDYLKPMDAPSSYLHGENDNSNALENKNLAQTHQSFEIGLSMNLLFDKIRDKFMEFSLPIRLLIIVWGCVIILILGKYACVVAAIFFMWLLSMTIIRARKEQKKVAWWKYLAYGYGIIMFLGISSVDTKDLSNSKGGTSNSFATSSQTQENTTSSSTMSSNEPDDTSIPSWVVGNWYEYAYNTTIQLIVHYDNSYQFIFGSDNVTGKFTWYDRAQGVIHAEESDGGSFYKVDENLKRISADNGRTWMQKR